MAKSVLLKVKNMKLGRLLLFVKRWTKGKGTERMKHPSRSNGELFPTEWSADSVFLENNSAGVFFNDQFPSKPFEIAAVQTVTPRYEKVPIRDGFDPVLPNPALDFGPNGSLTDGFQLQCIR